MKNLGGGGVLSIAEKCWIAPLGKCRVCDNDILVVCRSLCAEHKKRMILY